MEHILVVGVFHQYLQQAHLSQNGKLRRLQEDAKARASRLLELAARSRSEGSRDYAALLTDLAQEILEHARDLERRSDAHRIRSSAKTFRNFSPADPA